jgi:glycosyltransferase involved in cell wall biosynthesis
MNLKSSEMPLVTFVILAYNQKNYIIDAIRGATAQKYSPLEIIISDDGSTDGTFDLIESYAKSYVGLHNIVVNKTLANKCILGHFFDVVDLAKGKLLILSAGDDISFPDRVDETVNAWISQEASGLFSNYNLIDENGKILKIDYSPNLRSELIENIFHKPGLPDMHGASSAYDLEFVRSLPRPIGRFFFEDTFMTFMIHSHGRKITKIDKSLVAYRTHAESLSNSSMARKSISSILIGQIKAAQYSLNMYELYVFMSYYAKNLLKMGSNTFIDIKSLDVHMAKLEIKGKWVEMNIFEKILNIFKYYKDKYFFYWMISRVFGLQLFSIMRYFQLSLKWMGTSGKSD